MTDQETRRAYYARIFAEFEDRPAAVLDLICAYLGLDQSTYIRLVLVPGTVGGCWPYINDPRLNRVYEMRLHGRPLEHFLDDLDRWQAAASC